jgi:glycerol-3-phosphate dehydrogenase
MANIKEKSGDHFDVLIIGAGTTGCMIARELGMIDLRVGVLEKSSYVCNGQSKANGAIIHGGHDPEPGSLKAVLNVEGNKALPDLCAGLGVKYRRTGIFVVAFDGGEVEKLKRLRDRGVRNGVENLSIIESAELRRLEPGLSRQARAALSIPSGGIVDVHRLTIALAEHAAVNGAQFFFETEATGLVMNGSRVVGVETSRGMFRSSWAVNCAGVHTDSVMRMAGVDGFRIIPRKGEYYIFDKADGLIVSRPCFGLPTEHGKGIVIFPTTGGNTVIGGASVEVFDREDTSTTSEGFAYVRDNVGRLVPDLNFDSIIGAFGGIRAASSTGDFLIGCPPAVEGLVNVAGIASPGLSAAPAIARRVIGILGDRGLPLRKDPSKKRVYRLAPLFRDCAAEEKERLARLEARYGRITCRCEGITEGDILDALRSPIPVRTLDAVKFRTCAGTGRCQGAFDLSRILNVLSRELGCEPRAILKNEAGSGMLR